MKKDIPNRRKKHPRVMQPCRYPNAAQPQYYLDKLVDGALAIVTSMGAMTIIFFLITM